MGNAYIVSSYCSCKVLPRIDPVMHAQSVDEPRIYKIAAWPLVSCHFRHRSVITLHRAQCNLKHTRVEARAQYTMLSDFYMRTQITFHHLTGSHCQGIVLLNNIVRPCVKETNHRLRFNTLGPEKIDHQPQNNVAARIGQTCSAASRYVALAWSALALRHVPSTDAGWGAPPIRETKISLVIVLQDAGLHH